MAEAQTTEKTDSCEISINAKGQYAGKVKVYKGDIDNAMALALSKAAEIEVLIKEKNNNRVENNGKNEKRRL